MRVQSSLIATILFLTSLLLAGCAYSAKPPTTVINPASVSLAKHFHDEDPAAERTVKITITPPTTQPATTLPASMGNPVLIPFDGKTVAAPAGSAVTFETHDLGHPALSDYSESADAIGPSLHTDGDKGDFKGAANEVQFSGQVYNGLNSTSKGGGSRANGGAFSADWVSTIVAKLPGNTFGVKMCWLVGMGLMLAALAYVGIELMMHGKPDWELAGLLAGGGVAIIIFGIVAETYPWVFLILFILGIAAIVWYVWRWKTKQTTVSTTTTTQTTPAPTVASIAAADLAHAESLIGITPAK